MKTNEALQLIDNREFLDKIYQYAYRRCNTSFEAEDLCSEIIIAVIAAVRKQSEIGSFYAFVWTVAHRVYADYCERQNKTKASISLENCEFTLAEQKNDIEEFIEEESENEKLKMIFNEIAFLSKTYRDVMVMFYLDELKVKDIAAALGINETTVKQRLFSARNIIKKEVEKMDNRNLTLKPIRFQYYGTGSPVGNDPSPHAIRSFSQSLIYLCKDKAKSAKELSEELCIPMPFIEEELEIQCHGENGSYGTLRKLENGKCISNIIIADYEELIEATKIYDKYLPDICHTAKIIFEKNKEKILSYEYLSKQDDVAFLLWNLVSRIAWRIIGKTESVVRKKYFSDITPSGRPYTLAAIARRDNESFVCGTYGCDGISAYSVGKYKQVQIENLYGARLNAHFHCGHNLGSDPKLLITVRAIGGLDIESLNEADREIAASAIECGYLRKNGNMLEPKIVVMKMNGCDSFFNFSDFGDALDPIIENIAFEISEYIKAHLPSHLIGDYPFYASMIAGSRFLDSIIEECIKDGLLTEPKNHLNAEGVLMLVQE